VDVTTFAQIKSSAESSLSFKTTLISLFDVDAIVHREFVSPGQTVNQKFNLKVLEGLCKSLLQNCPEKWQSGDWFFHHDNAPAHTALSIQQFLAKNKMVVASHHLYSPDLTPCNFFCTHG
jgi:histone-lysine N-methyltransferase SETMAR